jgi:hypothetical protein
VSEWFCWTSESVFRIYETVAQPLSSPLYVSVLFGGSRKSPNLMLVSVKELVENDEFG